MESIEQVLDIVTHELILMGRGDVPLLVINSIDLFKFFGAEGMLRHSQEKDYCFIATTRQDGFDGIYVYNPTNQVELFFTLFHELGHIATTPEFDDAVEGDALIAIEADASLWALKRITEIGLSVDVFEAASIDFAHALATYCDDNPSAIETFLDSALEIAVGHYNGN